MFNSFTVSSASLLLMNVGEGGTIAELTGIDTESLRELNALGLTRGTPILLLKRFPQVTIRAGTRQLSISRRLSQCIYVQLTAIESIAS